MCVQKGTDASVQLRQADVPDQDSVLGFWQSELRQYAGGPAMLVRETTWTRTPSSSSSWYCWFLVAVDSFTSAAPKTLTSPAERGPNAAATLGPRMQRDIQDTRSKATVWAIRFGLAVLLASLQASEQRASPVLMSAIVHHSWAVRAGSGSPKPRRSSICPNVRTTVFAYLRSRVLVEQPILSRLLAHVPRRSLHLWPGFVCGLASWVAVDPRLFIQSNMSPSFLASHQSARFDDRIRVLRRRVCRIAHQSERRVRKNITAQR